MQNSLGFVRKAFTVILIASAVIWILQNFTPALAMTSDSRESMLACLGRFLSPLFAPLGFDDWRAVSAVLTGLSAKESVAGTFSILAQTTAGGSVPRLLCDVFTPVSSCSFLVFCLLYAPCIASLTAIRRPAANGGMQFILHCFRRQLRGGWALWCIRQEGSCLECCKISYNAGNSPCRVLLAEKIPQILLSKPEMLFCLLSAPPEA